MEPRSILGHAGLHGWSSYGFIVPWSFRLTLLVCLENTCFCLFVCFGTQILSFWDIYLVYFSTGIVL
jgi:hypothetical protein